MAFIPKLKKIGLHHGLAVFVPAIVLHAFGQIEIAKAWCYSIGGLYVGREIRWDILHPSTWTLNVEWPDVIMPVAVAAFLIWVM